MTRQKGPAVWTRNGRWRGLQATPHSRAVAAAGAHWIETMTRINEAEKARAESSGNCTGKE